MSHYLTLQCKTLEDVKIPTLKKALKKMNKAYDFKPAKDLPKDVPTFGNDAILMKNGNPTNIGFRFEMKDNRIQMSIGGEFYRSPFTADSFREMLCRSYTEVNVENLIHKDNQTPISRKVLEDDVVEIRVAV